MRGRRREQRELVTLVNVEERIPQRHPIRQVKAMVDEIWRAMDADFAAMYAERGRPSVPPERLLKAKLLIALSSVRSDRMFCARLRFDLLFQWFLDMEPDEPAFDASTFSQNMKSVGGLRRTRVRGVERNHYYAQRVGPLATSSAWPAWRSTLWPRRRPRPRRWRVFDRRPAGYGRAQKPETTAEGLQHGAKSAPPPTD